MNAWRGSWGLTVSSTPIARAQPSGHADHPVASELLGGQDLYFLAIHNLLHSGGEEPVLDIDRTPLLEEPLSAWLVAGETDSTVVTLPLRCTARSRPAG
jgi:hypothetical protein